ncbi:uncharacterized protein LOC115441441 [Manduca sexta]|uniref:Nucleotide exchange factor SIL1 n=1 Tax=Manduca sexta TaxID=7130 RepID=A0A921YXZ8_MANSE|nr:uncharacterized protein LOC115441441 [Manduca sexta]KAG6446949.1 hypothetical protein O3G_MSEX004700 [Manduca sexta]
MLLFLLSAARIAVADKTNAFDNATDTGLVNANASDTKYTGCDNDIPFDTFLNLIVETSKEQLNNVAKNVKIYSNLSDDNNIGRVNGIDLYEQMLQHNLKEIISDIKFNASETFMLDFIDLSNSILGKTIDNMLKMNNLDRLIGFNESSKIRRQQVKISTTFIQNTMCDSLSLCRDINKYSEYLIILLRGVMDLTPPNLKVLFETIPKVLNSYKHIIRTNVNFREYLKYLMNTDSRTQRDALDILDDVLSNPKEAIKNGSKNQRKKIGLLVELFKELDAAYDLNEENNKQWENIALTFKKWLDNGESLVEEALTALIANFWLNMKIWPLITQSKINYTWSKIIRD